MCECEVPLFKKQVVKDTLEHFSKLKKLFLLLIFHACNIGYRYNYYVTFLSVQIANKCFISLSLHIVDYINK